MIRADKRKYHYIYKITRTFDDRFYIGMHSTDNLNDGYFGSGKLITRSIKKHGNDKHVKEILEYLPSREALKLREREIVTEDIVANIKCMNLRLGGDGWESSLASIAAKLGNGSLKRNYKNIGQKALATKIARNSFSRRQWGNWQGRKHSAETRELMKIAHIGLQDGEKNSQFGTCWVVKENIKPIKIKKEQLDEYIQNGYMHGRKYKVLSIKVKLVVKAPKVLRKDILKLEEANYPLNSVSCTNSKCEQKLSFSQFKGGTKYCCRSCSNSGVIRLKGIAIDRLKATNLSKSLCILNNSTEIGSLLPCNLLENAK